MTKKDMITYLDDHSISTEGLKYNEIQKIFWTKKKEQGELLSQQDNYVEPIMPVPKDAGVNPSPIIVEDLDTTKGSPLFGTPRHQMMKEIIPFMKSLGGRSRGTSDEVHRLIYLHNQYYKRNDSVGCSVCIGNINTRMRGLYKKYKQYYD